MGGVTVIVPAYNESSSITGVLGQLSQLLANIEHEILVIDDGSTDDTAAAVARVEGVRLISHGRNEGYGAALKTGLRNAAFERILIIDADATYPEGSIPRLIEMSESADMVVGARVGRHVEEPLLRGLVKKTIVALANYLGGTNIPDLNSGLRIFNRDLSIKYIHLLPSGFSFTSTITLIFLSEGYRVEYLPIDYRKRKGWSKFRPFHDTLNMLILILRTLVYFNPLRVFLPLSFILLTLTLPAWMLWSDTGSTAWLAVLIGLVAAALQIFGIGVVADLFGKRYKR